MPHTLTAHELHKDICRHLRDLRTEDGIWRGELSSSALSTAVAVAALALADDAADEPRVRQGLAWLARHANADGGWGDTPVSPSNLSTTLLVWAALSPRVSDSDCTAVAAAEGWLRQRIGDLADREAIVQAVLNHYGDDRTFSIPILTMCALTERLGGGDCWQVIPQLPFELAVLPRGLFRFVGLPVVSYALPALISMGLVRHRCAQTGARKTPRSGARSLSVLRWLRDRLTPTVLVRLLQTQPAHGGFLEAAPLTGFVAMSLEGAGLGTHPVATRARQFLRDNQRADGSWPIDTDLATWVSGLACRALATDLSEAEAQALGQWLLAQQSVAVHPFTGAAPGAWGWTDLPGSVPDADDTAGALVVLQRTCRDLPGVEPAAARGLEWLLRLQNRDGGIPTFCRGWGRLPFDRSCPDITAHALEAFSLWSGAMPPRLRRRLDRASARALEFLRATQAAEGSWTPLWFGNAAAPGSRNPVYGTARVLTALQAQPQDTLTGIHAMLTAAVGFLLSVQGEDGGWGGAAGVPASVEETAMAVLALAPHAQGRDAATRGMRWLLRHAARLEQPAPIGLYFSSLWYYERLYPLVFAAAALAACERWGLTGDAP